MLFLERNMCDLVAQSVEHRPFKAVVQGSNPCRVTIFLSISFPVRYDRFFYFKLFLFRGWIRRIFSKIQIRQRNSRRLMALPVFMSHIEQRGMKYLVRNMANRRLPTAPIPRYWWSNRPFRNRSEAFCLR